MKAVANTNWKLTSSNMERDIRRINIKRNTPNGIINIKGYIKSFVNPKYSEASICIKTPNCIISESYSNYERLHLVNTMNWANNLINSNILKRI